MEAKRFLRDVWCESWLRQYIIDAAKQLTACPELQEDAMQEAWMRILEEPTGQRSIEWYADEARRAMKAQVMRDYRYRLSVMRYVRKFNSWWNRGRRM